MCMAAPPKTDDTEAVIVEGSDRIAEYFNPTGYDYKFKTSNSIEKSEVSDLAKNIVTGEYSYISPEDKYFYFLFSPAIKQNSSFARLRS